MMRKILAPVLQVNRSRESHIMFRTVCGQAAYAQTVQAESRAWPNQNAIYGRRSIRARPVGNLQATDNQPSGTILVRYIAFRGQHAPTA